MSSGAFDKTKYEADNGDIHPIRVQPETVALAKGGTTNAAPTGTITTDAIRAKVSRGNREYGLRPRYITVVYDTTAPTGYKVGTYIRVPILKSTTFSAISQDDTVTYLGTSARVAGKFPESRR